MLRAFLIGLVVLVAGMLIHIRTYSVNTPGAQALWNQNELYIFAEQNKVAWSQNVWSFLWSGGKRTLMIQTAAHFHRIDCLVYRITSTTEEDHLAKGWHVDGTIAPYKGVPHAFIGGEDTSGVYRWTGKDFVRLSPSEATDARSSYTYTGELFKHEGWTEVHVLPVRGTAEQALVLGGIPFTLRAIQTQDGMSKIELIKANDPKSIRVLYDFKNTTGFLSSAEYRTFVE